MSQDIGRTYVTNAVRSATPGQLIIMLYDGLIRFATDARDLLREGKPAADSVNRSIRILTELNVCLRFEVAPEFCDRLSKLYEFYTVELSKAMHQHQPEIITSILPMIENLRDAWQSAEQQVGGKKDDNSPSGN